MATVCRSLRCLISALTQADRGGLLFRFACSVVLWGGRGTADKYHWHVWGAVTVFWPHWVCPCSRHVCFPHLHCSGSRPHYREQALSCVHFPGLICSDSGFWILHKRADSVGRAFCALLSQSSSGNQELEECTLPGGSALYPFCGPSLSFHGRQWGMPCIPSRKLISGCDPPGGCQPSRIS